MRSVLIDTVLPAVPPQKEARDELVTLWNGAPGYLEYPVGVVEQLLLKCGFAVLTRLRHCLVVALMPEEHCIAQLSGAISLAHPVVWHRQLIHPMPDIF